MARGGLAGIWDRNKKWLTPVAELLAGGLTLNPWAGAAVGAAIKGLDRPGKGGIGFDPFAATMGGVEGYGVGSAGSAARGGITKLLTAGAEKAAAPSFSLTGGIGDPNSLASMGGSPMVGVGAPTGLPPAPSAISTLKPGLPQLSQFSGSNLTANAIPSGIGSQIEIGAPKGFMPFLKDNWQPISGVAQGVGSVYSGLANESAARANAKLAGSAQSLNEQKFAYQKQLDEEQRRNRARLTQMLLPSLTGQLSKLQSPGMTP
jgi:hypothetical protein